MVPRNLIQINASIIALSLLLAAPGQNAWAAVAGTARFTAPSGTFARGAGTAATIGQIPAASFSPLTTGFDHRNVSLQPTTPAVEAAPAPVDAPAPVPVPDINASVDAAPQARAQARRLAPSAQKSAADGGLSLWSETKALFDGSRVQHMSLAPEPNGPVQAPSPDNNPRPLAGLTRRVQASAATQAPFVAAARVVADLNKLAKTDPEAALKTAAEYLLGETDKRPEVRIGALRVLESLPLKKVLPVYGAYLELTAQTGVQLSKQTVNDRWWYVQRAMLRRIAAEPATASAPLLAVLQNARKDWNASVRIMAREALIKKLGKYSDTDPRGETATMKRRGYVQPDAAPSRPQTANAAPDVRSKIMNLVMAGMLAVVFALMAVRMFNPPAPAPAQPPAVVQPISKPAPSYEPGAVAPSKTEQITLEELRRIADAAERSARAAEQQSRLAAEAAASSKNGWIFTILVTFGSVFFLVWLLGRMNRRSGGSGGGNPMGMLKANINVEKPTTRFHDVAGIDESMVDIEEIVDYLRDPSKYARVGARAPKGVLFEGPPGSGKTLLAKALAGETSGSFLSMSASDFVQMFVGVGAGRVNDLFETARKNRPAIIFIDEIDALGSRDKGGPGGGSDEREQTINALLTAMDGFADSSGILVVAATNRPDKIDPALMRPGRFDRKIHVGAPEVLGREAILAVHAANKPLGPDVDLNYIARRTTGKTGAYLMGIVEQAAWTAGSRSDKMLSQRDLDKAVDNVLVGRETARRLSDEELKRTAYHESGHVLANLLNERPELRQPISKVTIVSRGQALGFAHMGEADAYLYTKSQLEAKLDHAMGGLVAEKLIFGEWSTGPGNDLEQTTHIARLMVQKLGMDEGLGFPQTSANENDPFGRQPFGDAIGGAVHEATKKIIAQSYARVLARLTNNRDRLEAMTKALLEKETLIDTELDQFAFGELK